MAKQSNDNNIGIMKFAANILFYWGIIVTVLVLIGMFAGEKPDNGYASLIMGTIFIGVLPTGIGYYLKHKIKLKIAGKDKIHEKKKTATMEKKVIMAAISNDGILTISQAALSLGNNLDDTKLFMETLLHKGYCNIDVNDKGVIEYRFPEYTKD